MSDKTLEFEKEEAVKFVRTEAEKLLDEKLKGVQEKMDKLLAKEEEKKKKLEDPPERNSEDIMDVVKDFDAWWTKAQSISFKKFPRELSDDHIKGMSAFEMGGYFAKAVMAKDAKTAQKLFLLSPTKEGEKYEQEKAFQNYTNVLGNISKDLTPANTGQFLLPPQYMQRLIDLLRKPSDLYSRCTVIPITRYGPITMPAITGGLTAYWTEPDHIKVESDLTFAPREWEIEKQTIFTEATNEMVNFSEPALGMILATEFARAATAHFNWSFYYALGPAANAIRGINMDIIDVCFAGAAFTWQDLLLLEYTLIDQWGTYGGYTPWYHMNRPTEHLCRLMVDGNGRPVWFRNDNYSNFQQGVPGMLNGYPFYTAPLTEIGASYARTGTGTGNFAHMFFGDWLNYWIFELTTGTMEYTDSHGANFQFNRRAFRWERFMAGRMLDRSFAKMEGIPPGP